MANEKIVRYTIEELQAMHSRGASQTDWARVDALTEEELTKAALEDPDNPPLTEESFAAMRPASEIIPEVMARWGGKPSKIDQSDANKKPESRVTVSLKISQDIAEWIKRQPEPWQTVENAVRQVYGHELLQK